MVLEEAQEEIVPTLDGQNEENSILPESMTATALVNNNGHVDAVDRPPTPAERGIRPARNTGRLIRRANNVQFR